MRWKARTSSSGGAFEFILFANSSRLTRKLKRRLSSCKRPGFHDRHHHLCQSPLFVDGRFERQSDFSSQAMTFGMSVCTTPSITFSPGTHAGNLFAGDDILISSKNTIIGNTNSTCDSLINPDYTPPSKQGDGCARHSACFGDVCRQCRRTDYCGGSRQVDERRQDFFDPGGDAGSRANLYFALIS